MSGLTLRALRSLPGVVGVDGDDSVEVLGVSSDSRRIKQGDLFAAVVGEKSDGRAFAHKAIALGARAVMSASPLDLSVPVLRVDDVRDHVMHAERYAVPQSLVDAVQACRAAGGRVVAVGTTVARALESAAREHPAATPAGLAAGHGDTRLFITPGYDFRVVDALVTNFHLPESTLLMLVSAFAGREAILAAYAHAVRGRYRFFSYGDAMFITASPTARRAPGNP